MSNRIRSLPVACKTYPTTLAISIPPIPPALPPYPDHRSHGLAGKHIRSGGKQTGGEPLARGCRQTNQSDGQSPRPLYTDTIGITPTAQTSIAIFLPAFTENPARISRDESHPPATLPASEMA